MKHANQYMSQIKHQLLEKDDETLLAVTRAVASVQQTGYGSIEITVHDGRVTQIEKREKLRMTQDKSDKQKRDVSTTLPD